MFALGHGHRQAILLAIPNGEERHPIVAAMLSGISVETRRQLPQEDRLMPAGQGVLPGANDLLLLTEGGGTTLIEVKVEEDPIRGLKAGKQSGEQEIFQAAAERLGHDYRLITNTTAFWDLCAEKGVRLRIQRPAYLPPVKLPGVVNNIKPRRQKKASATSKPQIAEPPGRHRWDLP